MTEAKYRVLLVDDDCDLLRSLELLLSKHYDVLTASTISQAKAILGSANLDAAVVDLNFEGQEEDGLDLIDHILSRRPGTPIVVLSGDAVTSRVVESMRRPLVDFIPKSSDYDDVLMFSLARGIETRKRQERSKSNEAYFATKSPLVLRMLAQAERILQCETQAGILILGESGCGKEVLAKYIAERLAKPIRAVNMANIARDRAESELFGHVRGAFTGAVADKPGLIEQAHNGIFFLDEVGECSSEVQAKLLRVLQEGEILPVGAVKSKRVHVRFLAATNQNLQAMVTDGRFRLDLLQRLNTFVLRLPPLRERPEDVLYYSRRFLDEHPSGAKFTFHSSGIDALLEHAWPGNVRELQSVIIRIVALAQKQSIDREVIGEALSAMGDESLLQSSSPVSRRSPLARAEVIEALEIEKGNRARAANRLGVDRTTLFRWIRAQGLKEFFPNRPGRPSTTDVYLRRPR